MTRPIPGIDPETDPVLGRLYRDVMQADAPLGEHPSEDEWVALATGSLADGARERLVDHVVACTECAVVVRALTELRRESAAIDSHVPALSRAVPPWWSRHAVLAAAALVVVIVGGAALVLKTTSGIVVPPATTTNAPPPLATPATPTGQPAPVIGAWANSVVALEVRMPADLALTLRGNASRREFVAELGGALDRYRAGAYSEAATVLTPLARAHGEVAEVAFYAGLSWLLAGRPADAIPLLEASTRSALVGDDARWFAAVARERIGDHEHALGVLRDLCARGGPRSDDACRVTSPTPR